MVQRIACKNNGSFSQGPRLGKHETVREGTYEWQLQRSSNSYQIVFLQIYQNDWSNRLIILELTGKDNEQSNRNKESNTRTNHLELLFLTVLAFPNASNTGLD